MSEAQANPPVAQSRKGFRRFGQLGAVCFLFFLVKGMLWLLIPAVLAWFAV